MVLLTCSLSGGGARARPSLNLEYFSMTCARGGCAPRPLVENLGVILKIGYGYADMCSFWGGPFLRRVTRGVISKYSCYAGVRNYHVTK